MSITEIVKTALNVKTDIVIITINCHYYCLGESYRNVKVCVSRNNMYFGCSLNNRVSSKGRVSHNVCRRSVRTKKEKKKNKPHMKYVEAGALTVLAHFILLVTLRWTLTFHFSPWEIGPKVSTFIFPFCISQGHCDSMIYEMWTSDHMEVIFHENHWCCQPQLSPEAPTLCSLTGWLSFRSRPVQMQYP